MRIVALEADQPDRPDQFLCAGVRGIVERALDFEGNSTLSMVVRHGSRLSSWVT